MGSLDRSFPVVGIGASAGGLKAVSELIAELPAETGMAFLLVQHLDPRHDSLLTEILAKKAEIVVETATDGTTLQRDHLYVIPPNTSMTLADGVLQLRSRESEERPHKPVNILFHSLAEQRVHQAVAVVLSGTDSDGAQGLEEIKASGGITMAQAPASAKFDGMPKSAIATGCVDFVLPPKELGKEIVRIGRHPYLNSSSSPGNLSQEEDRLKRIFRLLQSRNGTDFSRYKRTTVERRLARRMALRQIDGLAEYDELLRNEPDEVQALAQDFLIHVTGFFRDPATFVDLSEIVFPALFEHRSPKEPLRIWVPGCASGEEAYSIAMVLLEYLGDRAASIRIQIFATDLSEAAIEKARTGFYTDSIANDVSPERLQRFFVKLDDHYQISKTIRDLCVFARHDVTRDPPFSRLDLVSCRNLLIYLDQTLQRQTISLFHYALNSSGFLVLGPSETIGRSELFRLSDGRHQIYRRQPMPARVVSEFPAAEEAARPGATESISVAKPALIESERAQKETERLLLTRYAPASILIDDGLNVVYFHGETSRYLEHARGAASLNLQQICRPGLLVEVSPAIHEAKKSERPVLREGVRVELPGEEREVSFEVIPVKLPGIESRYFLILFGQPSAEKLELRSAGLLVRWWSSLFGAGSPAETEKDNQIALLRRELDATRDYLQATAEEHEAAKEEMKSAHEEALSANEEFLSTNEELETAKEELQSANEELGVTNQELRNRNRELLELNDELRQSRSYQDAIVETLRESLLILDGDLRVQKANRGFYETFHLRPEETLKQHIYDLGNGQWNIPELRKLLERILPDVSTLRDFEVVIEFPEIGEKTMLLNAQRLGGNNRQRDGMILLAIEDMTDRHISQQKLVEADQRKNRFLATLAHELRNPLAPIRMGIDLLRRDAKDTGVRLLDIMERQIQTLVRLVDDLLDIARIERDHVELRMEPVDLVDVVNRAIEASRHNIDSRRHSLSLSLSSEPVRVMADPVRLEQIVWNLMSNAAKYTDAGKIAVAVERSGDDAIIRVRDNGIGIASELLPQLFELFFQADSSLDRTGGGLGIGLNVTKRLVELHGGRIEGHSEGLGKGREFTVHLPILLDVQNQDDSAKQETPKSSASVSSAHRVMIVDDNSDTVEATAELAVSWGHQVAVAHDGPDALEVARRFRPDIALIDIGLPEMNGYELARRLRELPGLETAHFVAITGYGREEDKSAAQEAGFNLHFTKPVDPIRLKTLLATLS
jgi:two-component system, chemotaxis family, CheB/CheR fusion protein